MRSVEIKHIEFFIVCDTRHPSSMADDVSIVMLNKPAFLVTGDHCFQEATCGYVLILMATYWCTTCMPLYVTSLIPVFLFPLLGMLDSAEVAEHFLNVCLKLGYYICILRWHVCVPFFSACGWQHTQSEVQLLCGTMQCDAVASRPLYEGKLQWPNGGVTLDTLGIFRTECNPVHEMHSKMSTKRACPDAVLIVLHLDARREALWSVYDDPVKIWYP